MKTTTFITLLFCVTNLFAQTNYYTETKIFNEVEYGYQCDVSSIGSVYLYNKLNKWIGANQKIIETDEVFFYEDYFVDLTTHESWLQYRAEFNKIMRDAFSNLDRELLRKGGELFFEFYINPETGKVDDIRFYFDRDSCFVYLPISFFRQLELSLKEKCQLVVTDFGKKINYIYQWDTFKL